MALEGKPKLQFAAAPKIRSKLNDALVAFNTTPVRRDYNKAQKGDVGTSRSPIRRQGHTA